jgi:hypothetical protein
MFVNNTYGDKTLSIVQIDFIIRAVEDEKRPKWRKWPPTLPLPLPPLYTKSGGKTVDAASFKKALTTSQPIFTPKSPISPSQGRFL